MEWYFILVIVLGIALVLLVLTLVWYLNISGLYQVLRDSRKRQKRRAKAFKEVHKAV
jgi:Na+-transporting methylmalonyl-CoA/oxaloacetate decarboxylase gamma subunit